MRPVLLSLSNESFIEEPRLLLTRLYANFLATLHDQTTIYRDNILSLPYIIAKHQTVPSELCLNIENALVDLISPYFDSVANIQVTTDIQDNDPQEGYNISIYISAVKNSVEANLARDLYLDDGVLKRMFEIIENGDN